MSENKYYVVSLTGRKPLLVPSTAAEVSGKVWCGLGRAATSPVLLTVTG